MLTWSLRGVLQPLPPLAGALTDLNTAHRTHQCNQWACQSIYGTARQAGRQTGGAGGLVPWNRQQSSVPVVISISVVAVVVAVAVLPEHALNWHLRYHHVPLF